MMKMLLPALVFYLPFTAAIGQSGSEIKVRFSGFDKSEDKAFVEILIPDVVDPYRQQYLIKQSGEINSILPSNKTQLPGDFSLTKGIKGMSVKKHVYILN